MLRVSLSMVAGVVLYLEGTRRSVPLLVLFNEGDFIPAAPPPSVEDLVAQRSCGLTSIAPTNRAPFLDAFRRLLSQWPAGSELQGSVVSFTSTSSVMLFDNMERILLCFYCQTFFDTCGRPPVLPRQLPDSTCDDLRSSPAASSSMLQ